MAKTAATTYTEQKTALAVWLNDVARNLPYNKVGSPVVHVADKGSDPAPPAPAWYDPRTGDAYVHLDAADVSLADLTSEGHDLSSNLNRAVVYGLTAHEIAHSRWSKWMAPAVLRSMTRAQAQVVTMFEELRIESRAINTDPALRSMLRASLGIIIRHAAGDLPETRHGIANLWALIYGRALTTVTADKEVQWVDDAARSILGDEDVDYLTDLLQEAIEVPANVSQVDALVKLAQAWLDVVGEPEEGEEGHGGCSLADPEGDKSDAGEGTTTATEAGDEEKEGASADDDLSQEAGVANSTEHVETEEKEYSPRVEADEAEMMKKMMERTLEEVEENWADEAHDMANPEDAARRVFGGKRSKSIKEFPATAYHQRHVAETAKVLEHLAIPAISKVSVASEVPPGRLRTREAVRASAERAQGRMVTARPWEATKRRHSSTRPIVVGIATDTSSSMRWAESAVADFAYTWANAGQRVGARTAAVTFGDHALAVIKPGEAISAVRRKAADGGTEVADLGLAALDGVLKFSHNNGAAKLLVVVSDAHLVITHEWLRVLKRLKEFKAAGTKIIWVTPSSHALTTQLKRQGVAEVVEIAGVTRYHSDDAAERKTFDKIQAVVLDQLRKMTN